MKISDELPLAEIGERYKLQNLQFVRRITEGVLSDNVVLSDGQRLLFFKTYNPKYSHEWIKKVHEVKQFFADQGIPVILPIHDKLDDTSFEANDRIHALFPYIEGRKLERGQLSPTALESAGTMLAKIHHAGSKNYPTDVNLQKLTWDWEEKVREQAELLELATNKPEKSAFDAIAIPFMQQKLIALQDNLKTVESFGMQHDHLLHGDYHDANLFFDNKDQVEFIFDWEKTAFGDRRFELLRAIDLSIFGGVYSDDRFDQATIFIRAYNQHYPLTPEQFAMSIEWYWLHLLRGNWCLKEHYQLGNTRSDKFLPHNIATFDYFMKNADEYRDRLVSAL